MDVNAMRREFDLLFNNIMSNAAPSVNGYEISLFLTKGQDEIVKSYSNPKGNKYEEGIDFSPKRQVDFSTLIVSKSYTDANCFSKTLQDYTKYDRRSYVGKILQEIGDAPIFERLDEYVRPLDNGVYSYGPSLQVIPLMYSEYSKHMTKPYKYPLKNACWRLEVAGQSAGVSEFILAPYSKNNTTYDLLEYNLRYLKKPSPIIVEDLSVYGASFNIDGISAVTPCQLDPIIHREIIQRAVEIAKSAYLGDLKSSVTLGQRSE